MLQAGPIQQGQWWGWCRIVSGAAVHLVSWLCLPRSYYMKHIVGPPEQGYMVVYIEQHIDSGNEGCSLTAHMYSGTHSHSLNPRKSSVINTLIFNAVTLSTPNYRYPDAQHMSKHTRKCYVAYNINPFHPSMQACEMRHSPAAFPILISPDTAALCQQYSEPRAGLEPVALAPRPVRRVSHIRAADNQEEEDNLHEEPRPAATALLGLPVLVATLAAGRRLTAAPADSRASVQVLGPDGDDVVVVAQLARLGAESKVGNVGDRGWLLRLEAQLPVVLILVLQLELQLLVLEVGQAQLGRCVRVSDSTCRAACQFRVLAVVGLVVWCLSVAEHGHDIGEDDARSIVLVRVHEDAETLKVVRVPKNIALHATLAGHPHSEAIAVQLVLARDLEFNFDFPVRGRQRDAGEQPAGLGGAIGREADVPDA